MAALAAVIHGRPVLMTEMASPVLAIDRGERTDLTVGAMLSQGLHLIAVPWKPAAPAAARLARTRGRQPARLSC